VEVRRAQPGDAETLGEIFVRSFGSLDFLPRIHSDDEHRGFVRDVVLTEQEVWVADAGDGPLGFAALAGDVLMHLYVDPAAQGRGVGAALLERVRERRPTGFTFWVFQANERARRFYETHGCRVVRLTDGSGNEERTPDALYEWRPSERC
jgi:GNAT superfamily N-acetyltransferase